MKIFLTLTDFTVPSYQVKLRFTLTGNGYSITTSSLLNLPTTTLSPGSPVEISGSDLAPYLSSQNLLFSGIDVADYEIRKVLPEGPCQICVEVIDFSNPNQAVLSNPACTQVWFSLNDPPLLNTPFCGTQITPTDPQQLIFSWTPLHMNSMHSSGTQYVFELFEIRPDGADPNQVVNSSLPIFMQVTDQTFINYGITEPQLQTGMSYVWRVRAQDIQGRDFFRNNGYSSVCTFTYGNIAESLADGITLTLNTAGTGTRKGDAWWNASSTFTSYKVEVRKTGNPDYEWFPYDATNGELKIYQLEPSTQYECRVKGLIGTEYESEWSNISVFTTQPLTDYACGSTTTPPGEINFTPLTNAIAGLTFEIGQFELFVTDIEPLDPILQPGHYRGTGKIAVGFAIINIRVSFDDILVDDNLMVRSGKVEAITEGMDAWLAGTTEPDYYVDGTITDFEWVDSTSLTVWVDGVPQTFNFADHDPLVIQDEDGMIYTFHSDGTYTVISILVYSTDVLAGTADYRIDFSPDPNQIYGFDKKEYAAWLSDYEVIRLLDSTNYFVSYKSLAPDQTDYVIANIRSENPLSNVTFVAQTSTGTTNLASEQINDSTYRVTLAGMSSSFYVYAEDDGNRIGKLWVKVLPAIEKEIVFVPVNGASLSQIAQVETELNAIYKQANVSFDVTTKSNYQSSTWDLNADGKLQTGDVDLMSHYSEEMRLLRDEYFASDTGYNKNAYYIFIIPQFLQADLGGYMVRGKGVGFLKNGETPRTAAHELAHGIFALEHTFPAIEEGSTENLLDYSNGTHLAQKQWYDIHNPLPAFSFLDDEESGAYQNIQQILHFYNNNDSLYVQVPQGVAVPLLDGTCLIINGIDEAVFDINGKVYKYKIDNVEYKPYFAKSLDGYSNYYCGYFNATDLKEVRKFPENSDERRQQLIARRFSDYSSCQTSTTVFTKAPKIAYSTYSDCYCEQRWNEPEMVSASNYIAIQTWFYTTPINYSLNIESEIDYQNCTGTCIDYSSYGIEGPAEALFVQLAPYFDNTLNDLAEIVIHINQQVANAETFGFYSELPDSAGNNEFKTIVVDKISTEELSAFMLKHQINTLTKFKNIFGQSKIEGAREVELIFCSIDLWSGVVPGYNVNSIDNVIFKNTGETVPYEYSFSDLIVRNTLKKLGGTIWAGVLQLEGRGLAEPIDVGEFYNQLVAKYGSDAAFYGLIEMGSIVSRLFCLDIIDVAGGFANDFASFIEASTIDAIYYDPGVGSEYSPGFYYAYSFVSGGVFWTGDQESRLAFAYLCGLYNGVITELTGIAGVIPLLMQYVCDANVREAVNTAIANFSLSEIAHSIGDEYSNLNQYGKSEMLGRYTIYALSVLLPIKGSTWVGNIGKGINLLKSASAKFVKFLKKVSKKTIKGIKAVGNDFKQIVYEAIDGTSFALASVSENGTLVIAGNNRWIDSFDPTDVLDDVGDVNYKIGDNGATQSDELVLVKKSESEVGFGKKNSGGGSSQFSFLDELDWDQSLKDKLVSDIAANPNLIERFDAVSTPNKIQLAESWKFIRNAIPIQNGTTKFALDVNTLEQMNVLMAEGSGFRNKFGDIWHDELTKILSKNNMAPCGACGDMGVPHFSKMDQFLGEVNYFITNFDVSASANGGQLYRWLKRIDANGNSISLSLGQADELQQTLTFIKQRNITGSQIENIGKQMANSNKKYDLKKINGKFIELKSLSAQLDEAEDGVEILGGLTLSPLKNKPQFVDQFIDGYLLEINSLNDLEYVFNIRKLNVPDPLTFAKNQFEGIFANEADRIFSTLGVQKFNQLFGVNNIEDFIEDVVPNKAGPNSIYRFIFVE